MKKKSFADSQPAIQSVVEHLSGTLSSTPSTEAGAKEILYQFCEVSNDGYFHCEQSYLQPDTHADIHAETENSELI